MGICISSDWSKLGNQKKKLKKKVEIECIGDEHERKVFPQHLVVMVNGLFGSSSEWKFAAERFVRLLPDKVIVRCSECNPTMRTFDGVDMMGERLAEEVFTIVRRRPELNKISFVSHSLGGLVARYAIGRLYEPRSCTTFERHRENRIAGLEPMNFITVATPHLGSRGHRQLPFLCGIPFLERRVTQTAHFLAGRSGDHLFLKDNDEGKPPLLLRMVSDSYELKFISALRSFKRCVAYANMHHDHVVGWSTSSIRPRREKENNMLVLNNKYPHIVYIEHETLGDRGCGASSTVKYQLTDFEDEMIRGLNQVPWERIHVNFHKSMQRCIAHSTIEVKCFCLNSDGADVIFHMIDNFLL